MRRCLRSFYAFRGEASSAIVRRMARMPAAVPLFGLTAALATLACNGSPPAPSSAPLVFPGSPAATVASVSGHLSIGIWWSPAQPIVGYDATQLAISDANGSPVSGLALTIVPWMPAHGHGASVQPTVVEAAPGIYVATPLDFFMAGEWELRTAITNAADGGSADTAMIDDSADPTINVP